MSSPESVAVIGGGMAGATAVVALRDGGFAGRILLISGETHLPYERPPLSKEYLSGGLPDAELLVHSADVYEQLDIELHLGKSATRLSASGRAIELSGGKELRADRVLVCTGVRPRRLGVPGAAVAGVHYLHDLEQAQTLREVVRRGDPVTVIGGGFIGCEVAATFAEQGADVTLVTGGLRPMEPVIGTEASEWLLAKQRSCGVRVETGGFVKALRGDQRVEAMELTDGAVLPASAVVVGIGSDPVVDLVAGLPIDSRDGILVDAAGRTSIPEVSAAGDVARYVSRRYGRIIRVEHWQNAQLQAAKAVSGILDGLPVGQADYGPVPWAWSDQLGDRWETLGVPDAGLEVFRRGSPDSPAGAVWVHCDAGRIQAVVAINRRREVRTLARALADGPVSCDSTIQDESIEIKDCLKRVNSVAVTA